MAKILRMLKKFYVNNLYLHTFYFESIVGSVMFGCKMILHFIDRTNNILEIFEENYFLMSDAQLRPCKTGKFPLRP